MESLLTIEDVARRTGLTAYTLRYYERIGLIAPVGRSASGQRRYAVSDMAWIEFLLRLRTRHMPIGKMLSFASLRDAGTVRCRLDGNCWKNISRLFSRRLKLCAKPRIPWKRRSSTTARWSCP